MASGSRDPKLAAIVAGAENNVDAFYAVVEPQVPTMGRVAARLAGAAERDDVVQEALLSAWRHRGQFDPSRGSLPAWLLAITANEARRVARRQARRLRWFRTPTDDRSPEFIDLHAGMARLTARERLAIDCYYFAGLSIAETAVVMRCSEGTVKSTLADGRNRLRTLLR